MALLKRGFIHLYTGDGKGKTTAAMGLALRAAGAGLKVFIAQFGKGVVTGEVRSLKKFPKQITISQFGTREFIKQNSTVIDRAFAARGLAAVERALRGRSYDMVILDEVCVACRYKLIPVRKVLAVITKRPKQVEVVLTGRGASKEFVKAADIVTEMKEIKHYFTRGVMARKGIEY